MPPVRNTRSSEQDPSKEDRIQTAKRELEQGVHKSLRAAARAHGVSHQTLSDRVNGRISQKQAQVSRQLLMKEQEDTLVKWIDYFATTAKPLDKHGIYSLVFDMTGIVPGENWIYRLQRRYNEIRNSKPGNLNPKRAQNFNATNVNGFYSLVKQIYDDFPGLPPEHIWNMDEKGIQFGGGRKGSRKYYHLQSLKHSKFHRIHSDNLELMTIIECISPSGLSIPPTFVLSNGPKPVPSRDKLSGPIGAIATSPNGWTDNEIGAAWFTDSFIPYTAEHKVTDAPVLLFLDGHNSHESEAFREAAIKNNVIVIAFPSKCTHKLQPLDVVVFAQTQRHWSKHCDRRLYEDIKMDRYNIIEEYMSVRPKSMSPDTLHVAFSSTGIYPLNPNIFTTEDFAPAQSYSQTMHVPKGFPAEIPSSSPIPSDASDCEMTHGDSETGSDSEVSALIKFSEINWDSDSENYKPSTTSSVASVPTMSALDAFGLPIISSVPSIALDATASSQAMSSRATSFSTCISSIPSITRAALAVSGESPEFSDLDKPIDAAAPRSQYYTRSQKASASIPVSVTLHPSRAPVPESKEEMASELHRLRMQLYLAHKEVSKLKAENRASNAHCTIMTRQATAAKTALENQRCKTRRGVKTGARLVAYSALEDQFDEQTLQKSQRAKELAEAKAQKATEEALREARIQEETRVRIFTDPLSSYKHKDDLIVLSGALNLNMTGTISSLQAQLKVHINSHPELQSNARFAGLFLPGRQRHAENSDNQDSTIRTGE